jgi:hypothetical protein
MDTISDAIATIDVHEPGDKPSYRQTAKLFGIDRTTLACHHQGLARSHAGDAQERMLSSVKVGDNHVVLGYVRERPMY